MALLRYSSYHVLQVSTSEDHLEFLGGGEAALGRLGQDDRSRLAPKLVAILGTKAQDTLGS